MEEARDRIAKVLPDVEDLRSLGGTAGVSIGVLHNGEVVAKHFLGHRDVEANKPSNASTLYVLGSLTKMFVCSTCAQLVEDGTLQWDAPISRYIPEFKPKEDPEIGERLYLSDLLAHLTGLARKDSLWLGAENKILVDKEHLVDVCNDLTSVSKPRESWLYNNLMYALVGQVIERTTKHPWGSVLEERVLKPIGMLSTTVKSSELETDAIAHPYMVGEDGNLFRMNDIAMLDDNALSPAGGIRSNIDDMLKWAKELVDTSHGSSPKLANLDKILSAHAILERKSGFDELYTLGLAKVTTPATFGKMGFNVTLLDKMPLIGEESQSELVFYHNGALPGYNHCFMMVPRTKTAIVVLTNSLSRGDTADWIAQVLLQAVMGFTPSIKMTESARQAANVWKGKYDTMKKNLDEKRVSDTPEPAHKDLFGTYHHSTGALKLEVFEIDQTLKFRINGLDSQLHTLLHYNYDTFSFMPSAEERNKRGMIQYAMDSWLIQFQRDAGGTIVSLKWNLDKDVPDGDLFEKM